jgi:hypothetical protein
MFKTLKVITLTFFLIVLSACGSGGSGNSDEEFTVTATGR